MRYGLCHWHTTNKCKLCSLIVQHRLITRCSPGMAGAQIDRALVVLPMRVNERCWGWARCVLVRCSRVWCCLYVSLRALFTCFPDIFGVTCNCCCCCCWRCCLLPLHPTKYVYLFRLIVLPFIPFIFGPSKISPQYIVRLREWSMRSQRSYPHESTYTKQIHSNDHTHTRSNMKTNSTVSVDFHSSTNVCFVRPMLFYLVETENVDKDNGIIRSIRFHCLVCVKHSSPEMTHSTTHQTLTIVARLVEKRMPNWPDKMMQPNWRDERKGDDDDHKWMASGIERSACINGDSIICGVSACVVVADDIFFDDDDDDGDSRLIVLLCEWVVNSALRPTSHTDSYDMICF